ncbi:MAG: hypothetical protein IKY98_00295 [Alphaproteobacteria bacterium]|nr:hypothetical protein [Alphaproteobacteria bacterium]
MNKKLLTGIMIPLLFGSVSAHAFTPVLTDMPQIGQMVALKAQNLIAQANAYTQYLNTYRKNILHGLAQLERVTDINELKNMFMSEFNAVKNQYSRASGFLSSDSVNQLKSVMGDSLGSKLTSMDLTSIDTDYLKTLGSQELKNLTDAQLKKILGDSVFNNLSTSEIQSIRQNPERALSLLGSAATEQRASANGLSGLGITSDKLATPSANNTSLGPDSNRSDTFGGTGNGSTAQSDTSLEAAQTTRTALEENTQLPKDPKELRSITSGRVAQISMLQEETQKELASRGLSKAWIRQAVITNRWPKQEEAVLEMYNRETTDIRKMMHVVSHMLLLSVESQNYASAVYAADLSTYASRMNNTKNYVALPSSEEASSATSTTQNGGSASATGQGTETTTNGTN